MTKNNIDVIIDVTCKAFSNSVCVYDFQTDPGCCGGGSDDKLHSSSSFFPTKGPQSAPPRQDSLSSLERGGQTGRFITNRHADDR